MTVIWNSEPPAPGAYLASYRNERRPGVVRHFDGKKWSYPATTEDIAIGRSAVPDEQTRRLQACDSRRIVWAEPFTPGAGLSATPYFQSTNKERATVNTAPSTETSLEFLADRLSYETEHTHHPGFWEGARAGHGFACHRASLGQLVALENLDLPALLDLDPLAAAGELSNLMGEPGQTPEGLFGCREDGDLLKAGHILGFVLAARADWAAVRHEITAPHRLEPGFLPHH